MSTLAELGERALIARVAAALQAAGGPASPAGPGDDAAVLPGGTVATTDLLVEGVHFRRDWSSGVDVGVKAAAANLADVVAMGARPTALLVGLGAPGELPVAWLDDLTEGLVRECARAGARVVGGDVSAAGAVVLGVTALGSLDGRAPVTRSGARPGDLVVATGPLGWSGAGLRGLQGDAVPDGAIAAHRRPQPHYALGLALAALGATAMIDCSDGLAGDLGHVATASGVAIDLDLDPDAGITLADLLTGGEDHTLLATVPPGTALPDGVRVIGVVGAGDGVTLRGVGVTGGWEHHR